MSDEPDLFFDRIHIEQLEISARGKTAHQMTNSFTILLRNLAVEVLENLSKR